MGLGVVVVIVNVAPSRLKSLDRTALAYLKNDVSGTSFELATLLAREEARESPKVLVVRGQDEALRVCDESGEYDRPEGDGMTTGNRRPWRWVVVSQTPAGASGDRSLFPRNERL